MPNYKARFRVGNDAARLVLAPALPGTADGGRFDERRISLDHIALSVPAGETLETMLEVLVNIGAETDGPKLDKAGEVAMFTFRDPDNFQWEFFGQP